MKHKEKACILSYSFALILLLPGDAHAVEYLALSGCEEGAKAAGNFAVKINAHVHSIVIDKGKSARERDRLIERYWEVVQDDLFLKEKQAEKGMRASIAKISQDPKERTNNELSESLINMTVASFANAQSWAAKFAFQDAREGIINPSEVSYRRRAEEKCKSIVRTIQAK